MPAMLLLVTILSAGLPISSARKSRFNSNYACPYRSFFDTHLRKEKDDVIPWRYWLIG